MAIQRKEVDEWPEWAIKKLSSWISNENEKKLASVSRKIDKESEQIVKDYLAENKEVIFSLSDDIKKQYIRFLENYLTKQNILWSYQSWQYSTYDFRNRYNDDNDDTDFQSYIEGFSSDTVISYVKTKKYSDPFLNRLYQTEKKMSTVINLWRKTHRLAYGMKATFLLLDFHIEMIYNLCKGTKERMRFDGTKQIK